MSEIEIVRMFSRMSQSLLPLALVLRNRQGVILTTLSSESSLVSRHADQLKHAHSLAVESVDFVIPPIHQHRHFSLELYSQRKPSWNL